MKQLSRFFSIAIAMVAIASVLSLNSCRDKFSTQVDTVFVSNPDWDDSTWVPRQSGTTKYIGAVQFLDQNSGFATGDAGTVLKTTDAGVTWIPLTPSPIDNLNISGGNDNYGLWFSDANHGVVIGDDLAVNRTSDGGASWTGSPISTSFYMRSMAFVSASTGFIGTADPMTNGAVGEIWKTNDGGATWSSLLTNAAGGFYCIRFAPLYANTPTGVAVGKFGVAYWTSDNGTSWHPGTTDVNDQLCSVAYTTSTTAFAVADGPSASELLRTTDAGHTWKTVRTMNYMADAIATNGTGVLTVCGFGGNLSESTDGGATWIDYQIGSNRWSDIVYSSPTRAIMVGDLGLIDTRHRQF